MSKPILVGYDPRMHDHGPVRFGTVAARFTRARLVVVSVESGASLVALSAGQETPYAVGLDVDDDLMGDCEPALEEVETELRALGIDFECRRRPSTSAARALHEEAEREDAGLLVVGSSRRGDGGRLLLGSTAERLIHGAPCPIAVVPRDWTIDGEIATIGVGYVGTEDGREALRGAHALARASGARLRVLSVLQPGFSTDEEAQLAVMAAIEDEIRHRLAELGEDVDVHVDVITGDPADTLIAVSEHLDVLVCGSRGYGPLRAVLLGSVSRRVAAEARCPVVVLPRGVRSSLDALLTGAPGAAAT
jgi:nucleotide-binding universal stress UspA family protein